MSQIGRSLPRRDGAAKVSGKAMYTADLQDARMLHGRLLRSPVPAGRIHKLDVEPALAMAGVRSVATAADAPDTRAGWVLRDQPLFARDEVRFEGEPIACVVAETAKVAQAAVEAIGLEVKEAPAVGDILSALEEDSTLVHSEWSSYEPVSGQDYPRYGNVASEVLADPEGVDEAFSRAAFIVEDEITSDRQYQAYLEPKAVVALYEESGRYIIHTGHQFPFNVRDRVAQFLNISPSDVRVIGETIGGGFGGKLDASLEPYAALMSRKVGGLPVKLVNTRAEDMITCPCRENALIKIRSAIDAEGNIIGRELFCDMDNGAYTGEMALMPSLAMHIGGAVYRVGPTRVRSRLVYTNTAPTGAMRGVSGVYLYAALERHMDHIANRLGVDRREYRLRHLMQNGDSLLTGQSLDDADILRECFQKIEGLAPWVEITDDKTPYRGVGIGAAVWLTNPMPGAATVKLNEDGSVNVVTGANDNGSGAVSMGIAQIVAEEIGISTDQVHVSMPDTDTSGYDGGSQGSRTTPVAGRAARDAAAKVKQKILIAALGLIEANTQDLEIVDGQVGAVGDPESRIPLADVATKATWSSGPIADVGAYTTPPVPFNPGCASGMLFPIMPTPTYHVHVAEVEVDPVTGNVRVLRYIVAQEVGRVINPTGVVGQIQGAVAQGIGHVLFESLRIESGCYRERSLENYHLPLAVDIPRVETIFLEHPDSAGPFGAKGVGEPAVLLAGATILNALSDALDRPFTQIPILREEVLEAVQNVYGDLSGDYI